MKGKMWFISTLDTVKLALTVFGRVAVKTRSNENKK